MIYYTTMPMEVVMQDFGKLEQPNYYELTIDGIPMQVQTVNERQAAIVRILSVNPQDYLNPQYAPGRIIDLQPVVT